MRLTKWPCTMQHDASDCAAAAGLVGTAIKKGMKRVPLLHNAPGSFTWIKEVTI